MAEATCGPREAEARALYRSVMQPLVKRASLLSANWRTVAVFFSMLAGSPLWYLLWELVALNIAMVLLVAAERRAAARVVAELTAAATENDADRYIAANRAFKFTIFGAAASPALEDLIERVWLQIGPFMRHYAKDVRSQIDTDEHDAVVDALAAGDTAAARAAIERDIRGGADFLLDTVEFGTAPPEA